MKKPQQKSLALEAPINLRVPGSTSNLGAGFDSIGLALDLWLDVRIEPGSGISTYSGTLQETAPGEDLIAQHLNPVLGPEWHLHASSTIPVGRGLGSSGSATVAAMAILEHLRIGTPPTRDLVFQRSARAEGHPDNAAPVTFGGATLAVRRGPTDYSAFALRLHPSVSIALAIPEYSVSTSKARSVLPATVPLDVAAQQASRAAALTAGLAAGDHEQIKFGMEDLLALPHRLQLFPGFDRAQAEAISAGATGVTISGAGPAIIALVLDSPPGPIARAMCEALRSEGVGATPLTPSICQTGFQWDVAGGALV